jgi:hypothetical protein
MKKISKQIIILLISITSFVSCDLLDVDSNRLTFEDQYQMKLANDTLYSMFGVFSQLQKLSDSYVILGELRADLLDVSESTDTYLKEINNLSPSATNPYANNLKDYYAVINNCNYIINTIDTSVLKGPVKVMKKVYAASKAIRAWTYMQMVLNYGQVTYIDKPILSIEDAGKKDYPVYNIEQLAPVLIADLMPFKDVDEPAFGSLSTHDMADAFFPIRFLLGDLYLWTGQYESAANEYHDLMLKSKYLVLEDYSSRLEVVNNAFTGRYSTNPNWGNLFTFGSAEYITAITTSNQYGHYFNLDSLSLQLKFKPSDIALNNWNSQNYVHSAILDTLGDQRKLYSVARVQRNSNSSTGIYFYLGDLNGVPNCVNKWSYMNPLNYNIKQVIPYRVALLYLRYAEAVNQMGKPNLALAVMKYGLNSTNITGRVPASEKSSPLPNYMNFPNDVFDYYVEVNRVPKRITNVGTKSRGLGNIQLDTVYCRIPDYAGSANPKADSIRFVEDMIVDELALETAFEGNRFHDLMRVALRRNDYAFLANKVAAKHTENKEAIRQKLMDKNNWFLK